jgi:hypothetical protein
VAVSGNLIAIGAHEANSPQGSVQIINRRTNNSNATATGDIAARIVQTIVAPASSEDRLFGSECALSKSYLAVGSSRNVNIYKVMDQGEDGNILIDEGSRQVLDIPANFPSISDIAVLEDRMIVIGDPGHTILGKIRIGRVYVFVREDDDNGNNDSSSRFVLRANLTLADAQEEDRLGWRVDINNDYIVSGLYGRNEETGMVAIFST